MNRYVRTLAIVFAASSLVTSVASGQRAAAEADSTIVIWQEAPGQILRNASASAGSKVVKDAETGRLRAAQAGEIPETAIVTPTQIINNPDGSGIAVVGDDLMSESVAVKQPDGSIRVSHNASPRTRAEVQ
jgi:hypothetical protein